MGHFFILVFLVSRGFLLHDTSENHFGVQAHDFFGFLGAQRVVHRVLRAINSLQSSSWGDVWNQ